MSRCRPLKQQMLQAVLAERHREAPQFAATTSPMPRIGSPIYRHGYRIRLRDALKNEFTGLQCMVGQRFDALLDTYIDAHPSEHYNIRWYGSGLPSFLDDAIPGATNRNSPRWRDWTGRFPPRSMPNERSMGMADLSAVPPMHGPTCS
jgi:hypothetical protein